MDEEVLKEALLKAEANKNAAEDPYSPENIGVIQFIQLSRIYDVLMALLTQQNPDVARDLLQHHAEGRIVTPGPYFEGEFMSDDPTVSDGADASDRD